MSGLSGVISNKGECINDLYNLLGDHEHLGQAIGGIFTRLGKGKGEHNILLISCLFSIEHIGIPVFIFRGIVNCCLKPVYIFSVFGYDMDNSQGGIASPQG